MTMSVLAGMLTAGMALSASALETADVEGTWYGSLYGMNMTVVLNGDGTYISNMDLSPEDITEGTWKIQDETVILDVDSDQETAMTWQDGVLSMNDNGIEVDLTREPVQNFTPAEAVSDPALEDFGGDYTVTKIDFQGLVMDADMIGINMNIVIDGDKVTLNSPAMDLENTKIKCVLEDGTLKYVDSEAGDEESSAEEESEYFRLQLLQDGMLRADMYLSGEQVVMYAADTASIETEENPDADSAPQDAETAPEADAAAEVPEETVTEGAADAEASAKEAEPASEETAAESAETEAKEYNDEATVKKVQEALNAAGYDCGTPDGLTGPNTNNAIAAFEEANGIETDGKITDALLKALGIEN